MNSSTKTIAATVLALAGALGTGLAQARGQDDVQWSVTVGNAPVYGQRAPVYTAPMPVYGAPAPRYGGPEPRYEHRYEHRTAWDRDGDGIPNRYDRVYNPRWDRDGDGIPNRYDRFDDRGSRHQRR